MVLLMLFASVLVISLRSEFSKEVLMDILFNELMLSIQITFTVLTIKVLRGFQTKVIDRYLGSGDIVLLAICGCCFAPEPFFVFYICSLFTGILVFIIAGRLQKTKMNELPFAAVLSFYFILFSLSSLTTLDHFSPFNFR